MNRADPEECSKAQHIIYKTWLERAWLPGLMMRHRAEAAKLILSQLQVFQEGFSQGLGMCSWEFLTILPYVTLDSALYAKVTP